MGYATYTEVTEKWSLRVLAECLEAIDYKNDIEAAAMEEARKNDG